MSKFDDHYFEKYLDFLAELSKNYQSCPSIYIDKESESLEILLDPSANYYSDWIKGEGADISLYRDRETNKVIGARLPFYDTKLSIYYRDGIIVKLNEGFKNEE
jgi:hypothetical protein